MLLKLGAGEFSLVLWLLRAFLALANDSLPTQQQSPVDTVAENRDLATTPISVRESNHWPFAALLEFGYDIKPLLVAITLLAREVCVAKLHQYQSGNQTTGLLQPCLSLIII